MQNNTPQLILASSSPYRLAQIKQQLGLEVSTLKPEIDESPLQNETPSECAARLSAKKALAVRDRLAIQAIDSSAATHSIIIASDQTAEFNGMLLKKPGQHSVAFEQLLSFSGQRIVFYSGLFVWDGRTDNHQSRVISTEVKFRKITPEQIAFYLERDRPYDCLGAFKNESLGIALFESISSTDPSALTGLPLVSLCEFLANLGVDALSARPL